MRDEKVVHKLGSSLDKAEKEMKKACNAAWDSPKDTQLAELAVEASNRYYTAKKAFEDYISL